MKADKSIAKTKKSRQTAAKPPMRDVFTVICKTDLKVGCEKSSNFTPSGSGGLITPCLSTKSPLKLREVYGREDGTLPQKVFLETLRSIIRLHLWAGVCSEQRLMTCTRKRPLI